jgi:hypothetical protein
MKIKICTDLIFDLLPRAISLMLRMLSSVWVQWNLRIWPLRMSDFMVIEGPAPCGRNYGSVMPQTQADSTSSSSCVLLCAHAISIAQISVKFKPAPASKNLRSKFRVIGHRQKCVQVILYIKDQPRQVEASEIVRCKLPEMMTIILMVLKTKPTSHLINKACTNHIMCVGDA